MNLAVVTGATGFTGPFVVRALRARFPALTIRCVVRPASDTTRVEVPGVAFATADLRDPAALLTAFAGADTLVNVASLGFDWTDNVVATARRARVDRAVFISTTAILTRLAVASKPIRQRGERLVQESGLAWTILRPTMIYGTPADRNIARLIRFVDRSPVIPLVARHAVQQPVYVEDVADAVVSVLAEPSTVGRTYNISGGEALTLESLVRRVADEMGRRPLLVPLPLWPVKGALGIWAWFTKPPATVEQVRRIEEDKSFDHAEARADFGYSPRSFAAGVRAEIAMMRGLRA
jgi:uncharacterized protein YbjT (DUF2867 family)